MPGHLFPITTLLAGIMHGQNVYFSNWSTPEESFKFNFKKMISDNEYYNFCEKDSCFIYFLRDLLLLPYFSFQKDTVNSRHSTVALFVPLKF